MNFDKPHSYEIHSPVRDSTMSGVSEFMWKTYRWMTMALLVTGAVAWLVVHSPVLMTAIFTNTLIYYGLIIAELGLVWYFASKAHTLPQSTAMALFFGFAALNGVTMAAILALYTGTSVAQVFFVTAGAFAGLSFYGATTKRDLSAVGQFMMVGLFGLIIASVVNIFLQSPMVYWLTTYAGVLIFAGLTAWDNQKLRAMYMQQGESGNLALRGALTLYLDFINLFIFLLRIFGKRR